MSIEMSRQIVYCVLALFSVHTFINIISRNKKFRYSRANNIFANRFFLEIAPSAFTTIGVFGTFLGIYFGLQGFKVHDIGGSIPNLLEGMKTAFATSLWGIGLAFFFSKLIAYYENKDVELGVVESSDELSVLRNIQLSIEKLNDSIIGEQSQTISSKINSIKLDNQRNSKDLLSMGDALANLIGGSDTNSILSQLSILNETQSKNLSQIKGSFQQIREELSISTKQNKENTELIEKTINTNHDQTTQNLHKFIDLVAKNNTEALVEVMKSATVEFNSQMSALINKLVQENFKELNTSVERLNSWQIQNKEQVHTLISQFGQVSGELSFTATTLNEVATNTSKLTDGNSLLSKLIKELNKVIIEDNKFEKITTQLCDTVNVLKDNTDTFDETTNKLNNWVRNQMNFSDSVSALLMKLEEVEKIKDINDVFWNNTKDQLNQGVSIIERASQKLADDLDGINGEFYERLNDTLQNLDGLIQRIITKHSA